MVYSCTVLCTSPSFSAQDRRCGYHVLKIDATVQYCFGRGNIYIYIYVSESGTKDKVRWGEFCVSYNVYMVTYNGVCTNDDLSVVAVVEAVEDT